MFLRAHQRIGYGALFGASSGALKTLAADPAFFGTDIPASSGTAHLGTAAALPSPYPLYRVRRGARPGRATLAGGDGVHPPFPPTRSAHRLHESALLRGYVAHLAVPIEEVKASVELASGFRLSSPEPNTEAPPRHRCRQCWRRTPLVAIAPLAEAQRLIELRPLSP